MERLDMVPRSQEEKCVLKYVIYNPSLTRALKKWSQISPCSLGNEYCI